MHINIFYKELKNIQMWVIPLIWYCLMTHGLSADFMRATPELFWEGAYIWKSILLLIFNDDNYLVGFPSYRKTFIC